VRLAAAAALASTLVPSSAMSSGHQPAAALPHADQVLAVLAASAAFTQLGQEPSMVAVSTRLSRNSPGDGMILCSIRLA
jgi:hypothetical protein